MTIDKVVRETFGPHQTKLEKAFFQQEKMLLHILRPLAAVGQMFAWLECDEGIQAYKVIKAFDLPRGAAEEDEEGKDRGSGDFPNRSFRSRQRRVPIEGKLQEEQVRIEPRVQIVQQPVQPSLEPEEQQQEQQQLQLPQSSKP
jgi:hypothetical protein